MTLHLTLMRPLSFSKKVHHHHQMNKGVIIKERPASVVGFKAVFMIVSHSCESLHVAVFMTSFLRLIDSSDLMKFITTQTFI